MLKKTYNFLLFSFLCLVISNLQAQKSADSSPQAILLDKTALSGIGLSKIDLKNEPERDFFQKRLYRGEDISIYVVSSESWTSPFDAFWFDEFIYILNGAAEIKAYDKSFKIDSRSYVFAPKGFPGQWEVKAGQNYHYELSVITNMRADSSAVSLEKHPIVFDPKIISGTDITFDENGLYETPLAIGVELDIIFKAEKPRVSEIKNNDTEQMIQVLSGQITLSNNEQSSQTFYTGDFFVLPKGYSGQWKSEGHGYAKYFSVQKSQNL